MKTCCLSPCTLAANLTFSIRIKVHNSECKNFESFCQEKEHHIMVNEIIAKMLVRSALYII